MERNRKKTHNKPKHKKIEQKIEQNKKPVEPKKNIFNTWLLIILIFIIGVISMYYFFSTEFLFFFKDIGSDSINQSYPSLIHKFKLLAGENHGWSFFQGIGSSQINHIPTDPYTLFGKIESNIGISIFGVDYVISGKFIRIFFFHFLLTGILFYFYQRTLSFNKFSSLIGALLITFSGYMVVGSSWNFSHYIFQAVFLLFSFEQLFVKKRWFFFPFAILFLSNNLFVLFIHGLFLTLYTLFRFFSTKQESIKSLFNLVGRMVVLGIVGLMMNIVNVYSHFQKMFLSPRVSGNVSYAQVLSEGKDITEHTSLGATTLLRFFSSDIIGTGSNFQGWQNYFEAPLFYIGLLTLLLVPQIFIHLNKRKKIVFGSFLGFWILTLLFPYIRYAFLAFTGDYFRFGFDFFIPFTFLFFAIYTLNELDKNFKLNIPLLVGTLLTLLVAIFFPYASINHDAINSNLQQVIVIMLLMYSGLIFLMSKPQYKAIAQISILLLVVIELSYFSYNSYASRTPVIKTEFAKNAGGYKDGTIKAIDYINKIDQSKFFRIEKDYQSGNAIHGSLNDAMAQGYYGTTNYSSFNQLNYVRFLEKTGIINKGNESETRWLTGFRGIPLLQTFGNVKYHLSKNESPEFMRFGFDSLTRKSGITILKNRFYLPFGYTYDKYINFDDYINLIYYKISEQSLKNIHTELSRYITQQEIEIILLNLRKLLNKEFSNRKEFKDAVEKIIGSEQIGRNFRIISKFSITNFKNQIALLNAFVYEETLVDKIDLSEFRKISPVDTNIIIAAENFNFDIYKNITDSLKADTLQITDFNQSKIKGKISLSKTKMLFFTIPYDKNWRIKINGEKAELLRVNIGFSGIVLHKGSYEIELYYFDKYHEIAKIISIISIILFWFYLAYYFYKKRKNL